MVGGDLEGRGFDSRPTIDMHELERASPQLQMEQMFLRLQHKLFGDAYRRTMAHYTVVRPIGQGAMGMVYEAIDTRLSREVALKLVLPELVASERGKSRLVREAQAMAKIAHPNVVAVYDVGESGGVVYIAMEFVRGATLQRWLAGAPRSLAELLDVFLQAGAGLAAAHRAGIVHRDFKPDNVLVGDDGRARVLDFGLAFPRSAPPDADQEVTPPRGLPIVSAAALAATGADASDLGLSRNPGTDPSRSVSNVLAGTIAYMSPEQLVARRLDPRSDQFSFCIALYEALYGQRPFAGRTFREFVDRVQRGERAPVEDPPRLPGWLASVIERGLAVAPDQRYATMDELISVLAAGRHGLAAPRAQPPSWSETRDRVLGQLACTLDEVVAASSGASLIRVRRIADGARWLVLVPHDQSAHGLGELLAGYVERLRTGALPGALYPVRLAPGGELAVLFDDLPCVALRGLIQQTAARDVALALAVAGALTRAVYALAQVGLALDPAALDSLVVGTERAEIGPIDPTLVAVRDEPIGRYRIVGAALLALVTGQLPPADAGVAPEVDRALPAPLRAVIERVLAPDGYRSARGVLHDLELCAAELRRAAVRSRSAGLDAARVESAPARPAAPPLLATRDLGPEFRVSGVMRGRHRELAAFDAAARQVRTGSAGLVLVSGPSGIGKTLLIDEMARRLDHGWRIHGKFDQYAASEPYATLVQALRGLVARILDEPADAREAWRERIVRAVAPNAQLLFSVIPELHGLIGDQPAVAAIPPVESAARFGETLERLLAACAAELALLVIVLDDMQWCDPASSQLIGALVGERAVGHILWVCAFRDAAHPLHAQLTAARAPNTRRIALALGPLAHGEVEAFLADSLGASAERAAQLATFFLDKTDGNPLAVRTLLGSLHDQGLFVYSPRHECWDWDDAQIRSAELPGDIQQLIARKIETLSPLARRLLAIASCVGRDVDAALLIDAMARWNHPPGELAAAIRECVARGLLAVAPAPTATASELLNFTHDRVQQTAHGFLEPELRDTVQLEIGCALLARSSPAEITDQLFRIVGHLNAGAERADAALRDRIVELDLAAAQRALVANAFADAVRLVRAALALLPGDHWTSRYDQSVELHIRYMHALALLGERAQEDALFELLCERVRTPVHLGQVYELKVMLESSRGEHHGAIARGLAGLRALGERLPAAPGRLAALAELARTWRALRRTALDELHLLPASRSEDAAASRLLVALSAPAYLVDANLLAIVMMRIVRRSLTFGVSDVSSHGFAGFGLIVAGLLGRYDQARRYAVAAHALGERFGNRWLSPKVDLMSGIFIQPWTRPFERCEDLLARGAAVASDNADVVYASYTTTSRACLLYYRGAPLAEVEAAALAALRHTRRARDDDMAAVVTTVIQSVRCLRGETRGVTDLSSADHDDAALIARLDERTTPIGVFFCPAMRCGLLYLHGRAELACAAGRTASRFEAHALANPSFAEYLFSYAMAQLARWHELPRADRRAARRIAHRARDRFAIWARSCPDNFAARHALLAAELARVERRAEVLDHLHAALEIAVRHGRVHHEALAAELAARHCDQLGQATMAEIYRARAVAAYQRWGATAKVRLLTEGRGPRSTG